MIRFFTSFLSLYILGLLMFTSVQQCKSQGFAYDTRSDSLDLLHFRLDLDITDFAGKTIIGKTSILAHPLVNGIDQARFDLMAFTVDSVKFNNLLRPFTHTSDLLHFTFGSSIGTSDTVLVEIWYHGIPHNEPNFGGFHFSGAYAYNIGVAFQEIPHNFGRTWYPCFDNFIERSTYETNITTQSIHKAFASGLLSGSTDHGDGTVTWHWSTDKTIPSYLTSVAISDYQEKNTIYNSSGGGQIPVTIAARAQDTSKVTGSFVNLHAAMSIYENQYGPYQWERVGYCLLPVAGGAMEHAANIAYPVMLVNGLTTYEDVVVHELSHHWWGNLVTCRTAEDMWINEGMAVFSEYVFNEQFYGIQQYNTLVRNAHKELLRKAHYDDNGYWPLSGVPQQETYGVTSYRKGADIAHTLRSYLGDSLFFAGLRQLLIDNAFSDIDAEEFRDDLSLITGQNLDDFFDTWIFEGGWPMVGIDSFAVSGNPGNYTTQVYLRQRRAGRTNFGQQIPVTLSMYDANAQQSLHTVFSSGEYTTVTVNTPLLPVFVALNEDEKISHAVTAETRRIKNTGSLDLAHANFKLQTTNIGDSVLFRVEHNWVAPDPVKDWTQGILISPQRYWRIGGVWNQDFIATGTFAYNGRNNSTSYLDHLLITGNEDSIALLYRPNTASDWNIVTHAVLNMGSATDKIGNFTVTPLLPGEYTFGMKGGTVGIETVKQTAKLLVYPNPATHEWIIEAPEEEILQYSLYQLNGSLVRTSSLSGEKQFRVSTEGLSNGSFLLVAQAISGKTYVHKVVVGK